MEPKGLLTIVGSIDVSQFWPATQGNTSSDADTVHMKVNPDTSFLFSASPGAKPKITTSFKGAYVFDHGRKTVITGKSEIKIRLQGVDAPELHFPTIEKPAPGKKNGEFRQPYGASAAKALHDYLMGFATGGTPQVYANLVTHVDRPGDAVDSHGRFVGDIIVGTAGGKSINTWLAENGWAYPMFYDSMTAAEVKTLLNAWKIGRKIGGRAGKAIAYSLQTFDPSRTVGNAALPDGGKLNYPKIFRRQSSFWVQAGDGLTPADFKQMLAASRKGKPDTAYLTDYFLKNIQNPDKKMRIKLADKIQADGRINFKPEDLVFTEDPSELLDSSGHKVTSW